MDLHGLAWTGQFSHSVITFTWCIWLMQILPM